MVVHGAGEVIVDLEAIVLVIGVEGTLNEAGGPDVDGDGTVQPEVVRSHVVVVSGRRYSAEREHDVLGDAGVASARVSLDGVAGIGLEQADAVGSDFSDGAVNIGGVEVGGVGRAVVSVDEGHHLAAKAAEVGVEEHGAGLDWVLAGIMRHGLLHAQLVENPLALEADVEEPDAQVAAVGDEEGEVHPRDEVILGVDREALGAGLNEGGWLQVVERQVVTVPVELSPGTVNTATQSLETRSCGRLSEFIKVAVEDVIVQPAVYGPLGGVATSDVGPDVEAQGEERARVVKLLRLALDTVPRGHLTVLNLHGRRRDELDTIGSLA